MNEKINIEKIKSCKNIDLVTSVVSKKLGIKLSEKEALELSAELNGFDSYKSMEEAASKDFYSAKIDLSSGTSNHFVDMPIGYYDNLNDAIDRALILFADVSPLVELPLYKNDICLDINIKGDIKLNNYKITKDKDQLKKILKDSLQKCIEMENKKEVILYSGKGDMRLEIIKVS